MIKAWYLDADDEKTPASADKEVSVEELAKIGVLYWKLDPSPEARDKEGGELDKICKSRGYNYRDVIDSDKIPELQSKLAMFFEEHLHDDEEIRFFLDGSGYFDVRDQRNVDGDGRWLRVHCGTGALIVLPAGIYHRFAPDDKMKFHVMRLFQGEPVWTAHKRTKTGTDERDARVKYCKQFLAHEHDAAKKQTAAAAAAADSAPATDADAAQAAAAATTVTAPAAAATS